MDCEVLAIGSELLLGQVVDTNSSWIGERLAAAGVACFYQAKVGDNHARIVAGVRAALERADAVICCGGLGPTQDDITREAIAEVMGVPLERHADIVEALKERFKGRDVPATNYKQADVPVGALTIKPVIGSAPGLICPVKGRGGDKVIYAVPGVPSEMREMVEGTVVPDLVLRAGEAATIRSRFLRVWGVPESKVARIVAPRLEALEGAPTTIAFLASATEGVRVRVTTRATGGSAGADAEHALDVEEAQLRALLGEAVGGVDGEGLEVVVARLLVRAGLRLAVAESLTGGMVGARLTSVPGASQWFAGGVVAYASDVKRSLLGVGPGPVVSEEAAKEMALGVARLLGADVGLSLTGVAGPDPQDDQPPGTVFIGLAGLPADGAPRARSTQLALRGQRPTVREVATTSALDYLRRALGH
ncbi:MAG: CinA family nicotinamide mononucleotide deamidase-related protein [Acidimicrobiales bacterium]